MPDATLLSSPVLLLTLDLVGTFVFAISGAATGVNKRLDVFGVSVVAFVAGTAGGITRDVLIGAVPPPAIGDWRYLAAALGAALVTMVWYPGVPRMHRVVLLFDAAGLATFAVAGTQKALEYHANPVAAALLGMLTGIGGGMLRDLLVREIPIVLRAELYAVAALAASIIVVVGHVLHLPPVPTTIVGASVCFLLRVLALRHGWRLPVAGTVGP